ncbi:hypothetical protein DL93DRAFT_2172578 [Clavulina sp. PMI_390]|nr:hypothetical protein DL93DRAFT_2172578 [Clavulina sp. PMI_390]
MSNQLQRMDQPRPQMIGHAESFKRQLFPEIWALILSYLPDRSDLKNCSLANHQLRDLTVPLIWTRFTLHLTVDRQFELMNHLSRIIQNPNRARYISNLRILFLEAELRSDIVITASAMTTPSVPETPQTRSSAINSIIEAIFSLLDNVGYLTIVRVDRTSLRTYYPQFSSDISEISTDEDYKDLNPPDHFSKIVFRTLEGWSTKSKLWGLSTVNVPFEAVTHFLKGLPSLSSLSMIPSAHDALQSGNPQPLCFLTLRSLRTNVHWAKTFLSSTSPTHSLTLLGTVSRSGDTIFDNRIEELPDPVKTLEVEKMSSLDLAMIVRSIKCSWVFPNLQVIVHSSHGTDRTIWLGTKSQTTGIRILYHCFRARQALHSFVLRVTDYPIGVWMGSESPGAFARALASSKMIEFEGRSPPPRVILELGTLGGREFVCWIFTMESRNQWTCRQEAGPIGDVDEREIYLYLNRV